MDFKIIFVLFYCLFCTSIANLVKNGNFESPLKTEWSCTGFCTLERITTVRHGGQYSVYVSNRTEQWNRLSQSVKTLKAKKRFEITAYVRIKELVDGQMFQTMQLGVTCIKKGKTVTQPWGETPKMVAGVWYEIGGANQLRTGYKKCSIVLTTDANTDYYVDDVVVTKVSTSMWKDAALERIQTNRMADLQLQLAGTNIDNRVLDIEVKQRKHAFAFGASVRAEKFADSDTTNNAAYQNVFYDNFEWGVIETALNWDQMHPTTNESNKDLVGHAMLELRRNGIRQRCHSAFWSLEEKQTSWVKMLNAAQLTEAIDGRIDNVTAFTNEMCEQWDVNYEYLQGDFFEQNTNNPLITNDMFKRMNQNDPDALLFLNEDSILNNPGLQTVAFRDVATRLQNSEIPIGGLGAQGHFTTFDPYLTLARLDMLAEAGLPIMITEFGLNDNNDERQASSTVDLLTLLYSHPAVSGVIFWGFWDGNMESPHAAMFTGPALMPNQAGKAYQELFHNQWRTRDYRTILGNEVHSLTGYLGEYDIIVSYQGDVLKEETFTLDKCGRKLTIHLNGEAGDYPSVDHIERNYPITVDT